MELGSFADLRAKRLWAEVAAEFLATMLFLFMVCGTTLPWNNTPRSTLDIAFSHGLSIATLAMAVGHVSGGHLNPAVSVAMFVVGRLTFQRTIFYIIAQVVGGICGASFVYGLTPSESRGALGVTAPANNVTVGQAFGVELILTFILVFTIFAAVDHDRGFGGYGVPLSIGICVFICLMFGIPSSGASMNPARSFGPAVVMNSWKHHWIYWVAPIPSGIIAAVTYEFIFAKNKVDPKINCNTELSERDMKVLGTKQENNL